MIAIALLAALCVCGCKKTQRVDATEEVKKHVEKQQEPNKDEGGGSATPNDMMAQEEGKYGFLDAQQVEEIRTNLISWAPDYGVEYVQATEMITPKGKPEVGLTVPQILTKIDQRMTQQQGQPQQISIEELTRRILQSIQQMGNPGAAPDPRDPNMAPGQSQQQDEVEQQPTFGDAKMLREAKRVFGEWKSVREEGPHHVIEHTDDYFEFMNLWYEGSRAEFRLIRDGKLFSVDEYKFAYDANKGDLIILDPKSGKELKTMKAYENSNEKDTLYISSDGGRTKKVYVKVGRGGAPLTPEEQAAQDKAAGFGAGDKQQGK